MKKKIMVILLMTALMLMLCGCDTVHDNPLATNAVNTKAYINMYGTITVVDVRQYLFGSNGVVLVYGNNGKIYKTHSVNVVLVKEDDQQ